MKNRMFWVLGLVMLLAAGPAYSGKAMQMWNCGLEDEATEEQVETGAAKWLAAAKKVDGGENLAVTILFPIAVNATGETDFIFVVTAPTFAEWGKFWDAYPSSEAADFEGAGSFCPDSVIWEAISIK